MELSPQDIESIREVLRYVLIRLQGAGYYISMDQV